jgi:ketosteroid isomerase-like protein
VRMPLDRGRGPRRLTLRAAYRAARVDSDGDTVVEIIAAAGHARATGRPFASEVVRVWGFREGKAVRVRSCYDTYAYAAALDQSLETQP